MIETTGANAHERPSLAHRRDRPAFQAQDLRPSGLVNHDSTHLIRQGHHCNTLRARALSCERRLGAGRAAMLAVAQKAVV